MKLKLSADHRVDSNIGIINHLLKYFSTLMKVAGLWHTRQHCYLWTISAANLQVLLSVQGPRGKLLIRGTWNAPQTLGVKGQAHDRLGVSFGWAHCGSLCYIPQQQGAVLISSQQKRSRSSVCLEQREDDKGKDEDKEEGRCECRVENSVWSWVEQRLSSWKLPLTRKDIVGSIHQPPVLFPEIHYSIPHFAPHLYFWPSAIFLF